MDLTTEALRLGITMSRVRAETASVNIDNADVSGFRTQQVDFGRATGLLRQAADDPLMDGASLRAITARSLGATVHAADAGTSVNLDGEVAELETAGADFQALTTVMSRRFALMQLALAGRD